MTLKKEVGSGTFGIDYVVMMAALFVMTRSGDACGKGGREGA